jgi:hypothetical protein
MEEKKPARTLAQKLLELQKAVVKLGKNEKGYDYKFVSGSKLLSFIRPAMDDLGLLLIPDTVRSDYEIVKTLEAIPASGNYKGRPEKYEVLVTLRKSFTWVDTESGETLKTDFIAQGCNGWDKAIGSAETYAERYFLLKFFHIATDDDDVDLVNAIRSSQDDKDQEAQAAAPAPKKAAAKKGQSDKSGTLSPSAPATYKPIPEADYWKVVGAWCRGILSKTGQDYRTTWIEMTGAGPDEIAKFNHDADNWRAAHPNNA